MSRRGALALVVALAACKGDAKAPAEPPANAGSAAVERVPVQVDAAAPGASESGIADAARASSPIPADTTQLLVGIIDDWDDTTVDLARFERTNDGWVADGERWVGVIGTGAAWGAGLHGVGAPSDRAGPVKAEGDGRSPAGVFALVASYGYAKAGPGTDAGLPYQQSTARLACVDDSTSAHYNQILETSPRKDWTSSEDMKRRDGLYEYVVEVGHNPDHTPKLGSCIFLHVWRDAGSPTVGCTAMPAATLRGLLGWLTRAGNPVYVLLPRAEYEALAATWGLPT